MVVCERAGPLEAFSRVSPSSLYPQLSLTPLLPLCGFTVVLGGLSLSLCGKMLDPLPLELSNLPASWTPHPDGDPVSDVDNHPDSVQPLGMFAETRSLSLSFLSSHSSSGSFDPLPCDPLDAATYSHRFPVGHQLNEHFARSYTLREEIGSGGYGFVMVASRRGNPVDVAVKFIIRKKVPLHGWVQDSKLGRHPTEIWLLSRIQHPNIADFLEYFEDDVYYYLVRLMIRTRFWCRSTAVERFKSCTVLLGSTNGRSMRMASARQGITPCLAFLVRFRAPQPPIPCFSPQWAHSRQQRRLPNRSCLPRPQMRALLRTPNAQRPANPLHGEDLPMTFSNASSNPLGNGFRNIKPSSCSSRWLRQSGT